MTHADLAERPTRWCKQVPVPNGFFVSLDAGGLRIEWEQHQLNAGAMLGTTIAAVAGGMVLSSWFSATDDSRLRLAIVALGMATAWVTLAVLINRTVVRVSNCALTISHGPIPTFGNREYASVELVELFVEPQPQTDRFALWARLVGGGRRRLVSGLEKSQGLCLEQLIEEHLGIYAQTVPGAVE